ncbi:MAG: methylenetetrahydrofolate reductase, partial [Chloroflexi bacterium]|nr:methylenetetrahydrofolate reductase [Chloroflexota bacterium]
KETSLTPMPHLSCIDQNENELKDILEDYKKHGIQNVLALRGDPPAGSEKSTPSKNVYYAKDLVKIAVSLGGFSIGVAIYPEGHLESPNLEMDIYYTKQKIDAGADFAITQMFFDNRFFYALIERASKAGINIPIIPGIIPIVDINKIKQFSQRCGATIPEHIVHRFERTGSSTAEARKTGIELATEQCADLLKNGIDVTCISSTGS